MERVRGRGSAGAAFAQDSLNTDFALWGGSITFDIPSGDRTWNFSQSSNTSGTEFIPVALHEMAHVLGIGTADSWDNLISGGTFNGVVVALSHGSAPSVNSGHFSGSLISELFGSFGVTHGTSRPVLMLSSFTDTGFNFDVATDLDLAALVDIGWQLNPDLNFSTAQLSLTIVSLNWNTVSFKDYSIFRGSIPSSLSEISVVGSGDGTSQSWSDPSPLANRGFYQLSVSDSSVPASLFENIVPLKASGPDVFRIVYEPPRMIECGCD